VTEIGELAEAEIEAAVALWEACDLTRPWNDPRADIRRALGGATSTILVHRDDGRLAATVMVGADGHRAWVYYLAVAPDLRKRGLGEAMMRAALAQLRASRALVAWLNGSALMQPQIKESGNAVPIFRTGNDAPTLTVAGVCAPKVLVSEAAIAALTSRELRTALRHEIAHATRYDNLRKLLFRFSVFPAMTELEHAWSEETEMAADDAAVSSFYDALDLAAALIKVSRLGTVESSGELTMALLHSSTALSARVRRLVAWDRAQKPESQGRWFFILSSAAAIMLAAVTYGSALTQMHAVTEWLVR